MSWLAEFCAALVAAIVTKIATLLAGNAKKKEEQDAILQAAQNSVAKLNQAQTAKDIDDATDSALDGI